MTKYSQPVDFLAMKILYDFFPILAFFISYKIWGIYTATTVIMVTGVLQLLLDKLIFKKIDLKHLITSSVLILFGSLTLIFHDPIFIKWKVTIVYWTLALVLLFTQWFSKKTLIETILGETFTVPATLWRRLNLSWAFFFIIMSLANLYVMYNYSTNTWVYFKLFGTLSATFVMSFIQGIFIHLAHEKHKKMSDPS